jgi:hypothetical protein
MTEEEAKTRWCPFARCIPATTTETSATFNTGLPSFNRYQSEGVQRLPGGAGCIGSACMAWRWHGEPTEKREFHTVGKRPDGEGWRCTLSDADREGFSLKSRWERDVPRQGHCGLAGKP